MNGIFISYRREDTAGHAGRLHDRLAAHFGEERIFRDIDAIEPGQNFARVIQEKVASCDVMLVIIGRRWLTSADAASNRRLEDPGDFVRLEVEAGLERPAVVIPVLVDGATMPHPEELPAEISQLAQRQAWEIRDKGFHQYVDQLIALLEKALAAAEEQRRLERQARAQSAAPSSASGAESGDAYAIKVERDILPDAEEWVRKAIRRRQQLTLFLPLLMTAGPASAYYVTGYVEYSLGKSAPWYILALILFSCAIRALYIEGLQRFGRGDVYKVVNEALGTAPAELSLSALLFDYVVLGPICSLTAGSYLTGLVNDISERLHLAFHVSPAFGVVFAVSVTLYYYRKQLQGGDDTQRQLLRILPVSTVIILALMVWVIATIATKGFAVVPAPVVVNLKLSRAGLGWFPLSWAPSMGVLTILIACGHSMVAIGGDETLSQVTQAITGSRIKTLQWALFCNFVNGFLFPLFVPFALIMMVPDLVRMEGGANPVSTLALFLEGPTLVRLLLDLCLVLFGAVILSRIVNTTISVPMRLLNQAAEDGVLTSWAVRKHPRHGTSYRLVNLIMALQLIAIFAGAGDVYRLIGVYAFGLCWSSAMKAISLLVLRYRMRDPTRWKIPLNITIGHTEVPVGLALITVILFSIAGVSLLARRSATIAGGGFTAAVFLVLEITSARGRKRYVTGSGALGASAFINADSRRSRSVAGPSSHQKS
jgi:hypothetical protein